MSQRVQIFNRSYFLPTTQRDASRSWFLALSFVFVQGLSVETRAQTALDGVSDSILMSAIRNPDRFQIVEGRVQRGKSAGNVRNATNSVYVSELNAETTAFEAIEDRTIDSEDKNGRTSRVWRVTEIDSKSGKIEATTSTFFKNGLRAQTLCVGKLSESIQCVTASREFCALANSKQKTQEVVALLRVLGIDNEKTEDNLKAQRKLGEQCSAYAEILSKTVDPNKILTSQQRADRDENVVEKDLSALKRVSSSVSQLSNLKGFGNYWKSPDPDELGASATGMKNRMARMAADFQALSGLATMCAENKFVSDDTQLKDSKPIAPKKTRQ